MPFSREKCIQTVVRWLTPHQRDKERRREGK